MPDDIKEEVAEQTEEEKADSDAEKFFDLDGDDEGGDDEKEESGDDEKGDALDDSQDDEADDDSEDDDEEEEDDGPTAKERAEQRAGLRQKADGNNPLLRFIGQSDDELDDDEPEEKEKPEGFTFGDLDLSEKDTEALKEYEETYPDEFKAMTAIAKTIAEKMVEDRIKNQVRPEDVDEIAESKVSNMKAEMAIIRAHSDAEDITEIDEKGNLLDEDFAEWLNGKSKAIQRLFVGAGKSAKDRAEDFIAGLDYFKEEVRGRKASSHDKEARKSKKKKDDLHSHTMRTKKAKRKASKKSTADEEAEAMEIFEKD